MCGRAISMGLNIIGQTAEYNQQVANVEAQEKAAVHNMNYKFQAYELERQQAFDAAVEQITTVQRKQNEALGALDTALGERMEGQSARLLRRSVAGKGAEAVGKVQDKYQQESASIDLGKESTLLSTASYVGSLRGQLPSPTSLMLGIAGTVYKGIEKAKEAETEARIKDLNFDWGDYMWGSGSGVSKPRKRPYSSKEAPLVVGGTEVYDKGVD